MLKIAKNLSLPLEAVTQTIVVYGGKGMGKTNFGSVFAEEMYAAHQRFSVIDPMGVWWGLQHGRTKTETGLEVLILGGVHGDLPIEPTAGEIVADLVADETVSVVIDISRHSSGKAWGKHEKIRFVTAYMTRLYERQVERRQPIMQIIDEAARYAPQSFISQDKDTPLCLGAIQMVCEEGRNLGIGLMLLTQRSARLNKDVAELADAHISEHPWPSFRSGDHKLPAIWMGCRYAGDVPGGSQLNFAPKQQIGPGIYRKGDEIHFDIPELLAAAGWEDTPENRTEIARVTMDAAIKAGFMKANIPVKHVHRHVCPRCGDQWQHMGLASECPLVKRDVICARCNS